MRYMVVMYNGMYEDQDMTGLIVHLDSAKKLTPKEILTKWVKDFKDAYQEEKGSDYPKKCTISGCKHYNRTQSSSNDFCPGCGNRLITITPEPNIEEVAEYMRGDFFDTQLHSISQAIVEFMQENGWIIWANKYKADAIVYLTGVNVFMENEETWDRCDLGKMEKW